MRLELNEIDRFEKLNKSFRLLWRDACGFLLELRGHETPVGIDVSGFFNEANCELHWTKVKVTGGFEDKENTSEYAGYGMACLIIYKFTGLIPKARRAKGDGFDIEFVKPDQPDPGRNFLSADQIEAAAEVKGTRNKSSLNSLFEGGKEQSKKAIGKAKSVYVVATEFQTPSILTWKHEYA